MDHSELVLGIDGGGTKTVAWLAPRAADADDCTGIGTAGASNIQTVGGAVALANLDAAITAAFADAGLPRGPVAAVVLALAGSDRDENRRLIGHWAEERHVAYRTVVVHDALPLLAAGTPNGCGVALIAGTGSLAFGRNAAGRTARAGGWGYLFGDEGSAYALAVAGLRAAAQAADGRGPPTELAPAFQRHFNAPNPLALIPSVYALAADRAAIAALASIVTHAAAHDDDVAQRIIAEAADQLANMVAAVARTLELEATVPLALTGGLLLATPDMMNGIVAHLSRRGIRADPVAAVPEPVLGAVRLARAEAQAARGSSYH